MKINCSVLAVLLADAAVLAGPAQGREKTPRLGEDPLGKVIAAMTLEEKALLVVGDNDEGDRGDIVGYSRKVVPGTAGATCPIPRLGIPATVLADGPAGLRIKQPLPPGDPKEFCTSFPVATALAATWNPALVEQVGAAIGNELLEHGCDILLAPALNIHRNPLCGRNFEYYSEDPLVSGKMAAALTRGVQSRYGVGTTIKHYACNNQEENRRGVSSIVSERALREIYLKGFEIAIKESQPKAIMTSYNKVNGVHTATSYDLCTIAARKEWGFAGIIMTDWTTTNADGGSSAAKCIAAGNDLVMPGTDTDRREILDALSAENDQYLEEKDLTACAQRILEMIFTSNSYE